MRNIALNQTYTPSSTYDATHAVSKAFDGILTDWWTANAYTGWITIKFDNLYEIYKIKMYNSSTAGKPKVINLYYSNDGITYTIGESLTVNLSATWQDITLTTPIVAKYLKLDFPIVNSSGNYLAINEIEVWGSQAFLYLIKQNGFYYSISPNNYDTSIKAYVPLSLSGGMVPNTTDINQYGTYFVNNIVNPITINDETFKPIDKLIKNFSVCIYKPK